MSEISLPGQTFVYNDINLVELIHEPTWKTILLSLVKSEKMDTWEIDISLLADKYLGKVNSMESSNLRVPANAILCSAILLKYKSKTLRIPSLEEFEEQDELSEEEIRKQERLFLAEGIPQLIAPRLMREGKVSLDDLVKSIESILEKTKRKSLEKDRQELKFAVALTEYNIDERMNSVLKELHEKKDETSLVMFSELVKQKPVLELIHIFVVLLFLHNQKKV